MIKPLGSRVIVQVQEAELKTASGIILKEVEKPLIGTVLAVGPGSQNVLGNIVPVSIKTGDKIIYGKYAGMPVTYNDVEYLVLKEEEVIGIIND